jgi:hypothetical protein
VTAYFDVVTTIDLGMEALKGRIHRVESSQQHCHYRDAKMYQLVVGKPIYWNVFATTITCSKGRVSLIFSWCFGTNGMGVAQA